MSILENLNPEQRKAAESINGPLLILAGAGSGKTRTITYRIAHMISELGINPYSILAMTFTNKAAKEMKDRVTSLVGEIGNRLSISTFHSFGVKMLRMYGEKVGYSSNFNIYDSDDQKRLCGRIIKELKIGLDGLTPAKAVSKISRLKEEGVFPVEYAKMAYSPYDKSILEIYKKYQKNLRENNAFDFADILIYTLELLSNNEVLEKLQDRFQYIMIDEYQDTNHIQYDIVKRLAEKNRNLCVVGDEDQSIYGFRGADIRNILSFEKDYKDAKVIKLEQNYRSTSVILETANNVIKRNTTSKGKTLWTDKEGGELISVYEAESGQDEAAYIQKEIKKLKEDGKKLKDITILYRTNAQSRMFEEEFMRSNVPYKIYGGLQFYQRKEIKDLLAYLNVINNSRDALSLRRVINVPGRGIGDKTIEKLDGFREEFEISMYDALLQCMNIPTLSSRAKMSLHTFATMMEELRQLTEEVCVSELVDEIIKKTGYVEKLKAVNDDDRVENIYEFISSIEDIEKNEGDISLGEYLERISLTSTADEIEEESDFVKLMTIHNSKGLEFKCVFLVGLEEELFPGAKVNNNADELEEERRLCYVAITRAEEILYLTYARSRSIYGQMSYMREPSRFLAEMPEDNLKFVKVYMQPKGYKNTSLKNLADIKKEIIKLKEKTLKDEKFSIGDYIQHQKFGEGKIKDIESGKITIYFKGHGEKKFPKKIIEKFLIEM